MNNVQPYDPHIEIPPDFHDWVATAKQQQAGLDLIGEGFLIFSGLVVVLWVIDENLDLDPYPLLDWTFWGLFWFSLAVSVTSIAVLIYKSYRLGLRPNRVLIASRAQQAYTHARMNYHCVVHDPTSTHAARLAALRRFQGTVEKLRQALSSI